jgi:hypothetical protein
MSTACAKKYCPKETKRIMKNMIGLFKLTKTKKNKAELASMTKKIEKLCKRSNCNPTCKNTPFELKSKIKNKLWLFMRKTISNKENILKNGFYEKVPKKIVDDLKKQGAISGCYIEKL